MSNAAIRSPGVTVSARFDALLTNLKLTTLQRDDGATKHHGVRSCLNRHYYNSTSETANSFLVGSWGKSTEVRPPRDIDLLFELPWSVYTRFDARPGNKQSQLLQEVKGVLASTYASTKMRADGQVVVVPFSSYAVEVVPAFKLDATDYLICDTNNGGRYKGAKPYHEQAHVKVSNDETKGNTRDLIRMMKCWQAYCAVPLKSFYIELLAVEFLSSWTHKGGSTVYYDWMSRDFFAFLKGKYSWSTVTVPGTYESIALGDAWKSKAETAHGRAVKATEYEADNCPYLAGGEWQKIFGTQIPTG